MSWRPSTWRQDYLGWYLFVAAGVSYFVGQWGRAIWKMADPRALETTLQTFGLLLAAAVFGAVIVDVFRRLINDPPDPKRRRTPWRKLPTIFLFVIIAGVALMSVDEDLGRVVGLIGVVGLGVSAFFDVEIVGPEKGDGK